MIVCLNYVRSFRVLDTNMALKWFHLRDKARFGFNKVSMLGLHCKQWDCCMAGNMSVRPLNFQPENRVEQLFTVLHFSTELASINP